MLKHQSYHWPWRRPAAGRHSIHVLGRKYVEGTGRTAKKTEVLINNKVSADVENLLLEAVGCPLQPESIFENVPEEF